MSSRPALDVSKLPSVTFDVRAPIWWGNTLLLLIETTMFGITVSTYFSLRQNFKQWPPPLAGQPFSLRAPLPQLLYGSINMALLLVSLIPMVWFDRAARR